MCGGGLIHATKLRWVNHGTCFFQYPDRVGFHQFGGHGGERDWPDVFGNVFHGDLFGQGCLVGRSPPIRNVCFSQGAILYGTHGSSKDIGEVLEEPVGNIIWANSFIHLQGKELLESGVNRYDIFIWEGLGWTFRYNVFGEGLKVGTDACKKFIDLTKSHALNCESLIVL